MFVSRFAFLLALTFISLAGFNTAQAADRLQPGDVLIYRGAIEKLERDNAPTPGKQFELTLIVRSSDESGTQFDWLIDEQGASAWPWIERFGRLAISADGKPVGAAGPSALYEHSLGKSVVPLHPPLWPHEPKLAAGVMWNADEHDYQVEGKRKIAEVDSWQVDVRNNYGPKRVVWVAVDGSLVAGCDERVFMGQGTEYQSQLRLASRSRLSDEEREANEAGFTTLLDLRGQLKRPTRSQQADWTDEHRALLQPAVAELEKKITQGPLVRLVRVASRDLQSQSGRADALGELASRNLDKPLPDFELTTLAGETVRTDDLKGKLVVLHFWDYRDEPLKEPYGQVGYLEFLFGRHREAGLQVYGVAVDGRLREEGTKRAAMTGIRRLKTFMNLTYPIMLDGGEWISKLGDPRTVGAELPLFVVVDRSGKVVHFRTGTYAVDQQQGLKELDKLIAQQLKK